MDYEQDGPDVQYWDFRSYMAGADPAESKDSQSVKMIRTNTGGYIIDYSGTDIK